MTLASEAFDKLALNYDDVWTRSAVGRSQRAAVWRVIDTLFAHGEHVLDLGCGTGEDALHLMSSGIRVTSIDASAEMVRMARLRGVDANQLTVENIEALNGLYDGALSNFGALNCVEDLETAAKKLARLVRPGGFVAICTIGRFCAWETAYYLFHRERAKAFRRLKGETTASLGVKVFYPSVRRLVTAFRPNFSLMRWTGIGVFVPPSYVTSYSASAIDRFSALDEIYAGWPLIRALADHRLLVFMRR